MDADEFCLVLTPTQGAARRAIEAVRERFARIDDAPRRDLATVVGELVEASVKRRPRKPITVSVLVGDDAIRGEVSDQGELVPFEIQLVRVA
jgi:anti-sigma regulatory factor (Ser/Thr protein kinase)